MRTYTMRKKSLIFSLDSSTDPINLNSKKIHNLYKLNHLANKLCKKYCLKTNNFLCSKIFNQNNNLNFPLF